MSFDEQEWEDVEPIPQDDGPNPLAPINYDPDYSRIMDYFRAISRKEEYNNDIRNNSAWNQRYFVLFHNPKEPSDDLISREINYAISKIKITPNNISPWNYVKGVIAKSNQEIDILESLCKELIEKENISPHALGCLVNIYERRAKLGFEKDKDEGIKKYSGNIRNGNKLHENYSIISI
ncbi:9231_t:CDS:2 [Entrophospora sp. SA101]|nr:9231_t:CDS:2 [Entrophospora sp. SA101]